ncbi:MULTISPECIES: hypothetical protein [unclassified Arthrobacter]|uniref:phage terminase small subunit n=1 Tax=unclassified Arthrobacter TaxID=235627 RepID=UPI00046721E7|nr:MULTISPECIES: hypothetical protein [unclassified Arthrobacter]
MSGPAAKRDAERARRNEPASGAARHGQLRPVTIPNADRKNWHPRATALFESFKTSGQRDFMQDTDWQMLKIACDLLTQYYERPKAMDMQNIERILSSLGVTEGARRQQLRIELEVPPVEEKSAADAAREMYAARMGAPALTLVQNAG